jgi:hypothetical protein
VIEKDPRGDAEAAIDRSVVEDIGVCAVGNSVDACAGRCNAIGRQCLANGDVARAIVIYGAADDEVAGSKCGFTLSENNAGNQWESEGHADVMCAEPGKNTMCQRIILLELRIDDAEIGKNGECRR